MTEYKVLYVPEPSPDPATKALRDIFELLVSFVLIGAASLAVAFCVGWMLSLPEQGFLSDGWVVGISLLSFFATIFAINRSFDGEAGGRRRDWLMTMSRRYGYPIVLLAGLYMDGLYNDYRERASPAVGAQQAALAACSELPRCLALADQYNFGNPVLPLIAKPSR